MTAYIFPGQGAQYVGMGKDLYEQSPRIATLMEQANEILGFRLTDIMFKGTDEELRQTRVTQPAIFLHSVCAYLYYIEQGGAQPDCVAGHSLGEFSALVAANAIRFEDALVLVQKRALAMQKACDMQPSTMAAVIGLSDDAVEEACRNLPGVTAANFNCTGQVVISGGMEEIQAACLKFKELGAKRALPLPVNGAFHSPYMQPAADELAEAINATEFKDADCPVYQNFTALPVTDANELKENLLAQLTAPVRWTMSVKNMVADGVTHFHEFGPGNVLKGLVKKINKEVICE